MDAARNIQIKQAANNPNILSPLVGAPPQSNLAQRAEAQPNPQAAYAEAGKVGQEMAGRLYGSGNLQGMANNWDQMIGELAKYDVMQEQQMIPKQNFTPGYVANPVDQAGFIGNMGTNLSGGIQRTGSAVQSVESGYQNAINQITNKFLDFYQLAEDRRERESARKEREDRERMDWLLQKVGLTGGTIKDPYTGEDVTVKSPEQKLEEELKLRQQYGEDKGVVARTEDLGDRIIFYDKYGNVIRTEQKTQNDIFKTLGSSTTTPQGKQYFPPPMSAPAGTTHSYGGATWRSLGGSRWEMTGTGTSSQPTLNLGSSSTSGSSATMNKPPLSSFWSQ